MNINNYKEFFKTDNKSGKKYKKDWLSKFHPEIYNTINEFSIKHQLTNLPFQQQVWHFINEKPNQPECLNCFSIPTFKKNNYNDFCSLSCANSNKELMQQRVEETNMKKFGFKYFSQHESWIVKVKKTKKEKYGDENYNNYEKHLKTKLEKYGSENYNNKDKSKITLRETLIERIKNEAKDQFISYELTDNNIKLKCCDCNQEYLIYNTLFNYRINTQIKLCTICNPIGATQQSYFEKEIVDFIRNDLKIECEERNRELIKPYEVDIFIPSHNLAIEFDGLFWHSEVYKDNNFHLKKTELCEKQNINLIHIFEDEWAFKRDIVKSIIRNKLNVNVNKVYGRKCFIKELSVDEYKTFINENHIQGYVYSKIRLGLIYNGELVCAISFDDNRKLMGLNKIEDHYELIRFCNKLNTNVIGGFTKLLSYFINNNTVKNIITYADRRYFDGSGYEKNGFTFIKNTSPNYWYINQYKREYRYKYRKSVLIEQGFDKEKSEHQIMLERGIYRIYDCGNKKYEMVI